MAASWDVEGAEIVLPLRNASYGGGVMALSPLERVTVVLEVSMGSPDVSSFLGWRGLMGREHERFSAKSLTAGAVPEVVALRFASWEVRLS